jgi:hypothetical protein
MPRYALVNPSNVVVFLGRNIDPNVQTKQGWRWLECPDVVVPAFDPDAEVREGPFYVVGSNSVSEEWTVRSMTAQEIGDRKDARINLLSGSNAVLRVLLTVHNRVRTLEGQSTHTMAQFKAAIKAML